MISSNHSSSLQSNGHAIQELNKNKLTIYDIVNYEQSQMDRMSSMSKDAREVNTV